MKFNLIVLSYLNLASAPDHSYCLSWYFSLCATGNHSTNGLRITVLGDLDHQPSLRSIIKNDLFVHLNY